MTFSIPEVDQLGWGQHLKDHLAQLNDPETGGLIHVLNVAELCGDDHLSLFDNETLLH